VQRFSKCSIARHRVANSRFSRKFPDPYYECTIFMWSSLGSHSKRCTSSVCPLLSITRNRKAVETSNLVAMLGPTWTRVTAGESVIKGKVTGNVNVTIVFVHIFVKTEKWIVLRQTKSKTDSQPILRISANTFHRNFHDIWLSVGLHDVMYLSFTHYEEVTTYTSDWTEM